MVPGGLGSSPWKVLRYANSRIAMTPVAGETADSEPALREVAAEVFGSWVDGTSALFALRGLADADARDLAFAVISALEGAFVLARTLRSDEPLIAAGRVMGAAARETPVAR